MEDCYKEPSITVQWKLKVIEWNMNTAHTHIESLRFTLNDDSQSYVFGKRNEPKLVKGLFWNSVKKALGISFTNQH